MKILYENSSNFKSYKFSYKLVVIPFSSFRMNQKQKPYFWEVGGLETKNICVLCIVNRGLLQRHDKFNKRL